MTELTEENAVKVQSLLHEIKVIIETKHAGDASSLLNGYDGWYLLGVGKNLYADQEEEQFLYTIGCTRDRSQWDNYESNF